MVFQTAHGALLGFAGRRVDLPNRIGLHRQRRGTGRLLLGRRSGHVLLATAQAVLLPDVPRTFPPSAVP